MLNPTLPAGFSRLLYLRKADKPYQEWVVVVPQMDQGISQ